jgi:hypothetical protein
VKKGAKNREAKSFKHMKMKYIALLKMATQAETCSETVKTNTIKLHADGNITCNTHYEIVLFSPRKFLVSFFHKQETNTNIVNFNARKLQNACGSLPWEPPTCS